MTWLEAKEARERAAAEAFRAHVEKYPRGEPEKTEIYRHAPGAAVLKRGLEKASLTPPGAPSVIKEVALEATGGVIGAKAAPYIEPAWQAAGPLITPVTGPVVEGAKKYGGEALEAAKKAIMGTPGKGKAAKEVAEEGVEEAVETVRVPEVLPPTKDQLRALQGTSLTDEAGQPAVVYHGTRADFDELDFDTGLGVHVGPAEAAVNRIGIKDAEDIYGARGRMSNLGREKSSARVLPMYVNLKRPLRLTEEATGRPGEGTWDANSVIRRVMEDAETKGVPGISEAEIDAWYDDELGFGDVVFTDAYVTERELDDAVKGWLKSKGYDGIVYDNAFEGGGDSYILFDKNQVVSAQEAAEKAATRAPFHDESVTARATEKIREGLKPGGEAVEEAADTAATAGKEADRYFDPEALKQWRRALNADMSHDSLVYLTPEQFLRMAKPIPGGVAPYKAERVAKALEEGAKFEDIPLLQITNAGRVRGHEGRHRAMALRDKGVQRIPVRIHASDMRWNQQAPISEDLSFHQRAVREHEYVENLPEELVGEDGVSRIPFPFHREGPKRGQPRDMYRADARGQDVDPITSRVPERPPPEPDSAEALIQQQIEEEQVADLLSRIFSDLE